MPRIVAALFSMASLAVCLASPLLYFWGSIGVDAFRQLLVAASLAWFVSATAWAALRAN